MGIARALIMNPKLIIADECISALDVSIQAQVVNLMKDIQQETSCAFLFIAHDLAMVKYISDRIGVLHLGYMVESGTTEEIFNRPVHPYTKSLLSAIPHANPEVEKRRKSVAYDYATSGIDYAKGTERSLEGMQKERSAVWRAAIRCWPRRRNSGAGQPDGIRRTHKTGRAMTQPCRFFTEQSVSVLPHSEHKPRMNTAIL